MHGTALPALSLPVIPNTINSIILLCQTYSATLSGHLLSQRPHPDVQDRVHTEESDFFSPIMIHSHPCPILWEP